MIDNLSGPMAGVASKVGANVSKLDAASQTFGSMAKAGAVMQETGSQIVNAVLAPVEATFETRRALGELASLGVQDLEAVENAARSFSDQWAGTSKADFISAAYDIKSGIASLSDEGVAEFTSLAALTAKATKSTAGEMTSLFATGYGIYKDYYSDLSDMEFGEMFSAGISDAVRAFKTSGSGMAQAIQNLGASATTAQVPLEEQLSVLGMLQATMGGAEAGTKYKAFLRSATKGGEELGLKFTDANNQLLSMPEILDILRGKFGETMDAAEKMELQKAFGDTEAVALIDLMYNKVGDLQDNIVNMYGSLGKGVSVTEQMASAIQETEPERFERLKIRNLLPFSDAKEGPLSTLTLSGQRTMTTYAHGLTLAGDAPAEAMNKSLQQVQGALDRKPEKKVDLGGGKKDKDESSDEGGSGKGKQVIIHKLLVPVDLKKIKDLQQLLALLQEVEDYAAANEDGEPGDDEDAVPAPA